MTEHYEYTRIETVYASNPCDEMIKHAIGIVAVVDGEGFGTYGSCGIVHEEPRKRNRQIDVGVSYE